jgi:hypothetical protein
MAYRLVGSSLLPDETNSDGICGEAVRLHQSFTAWIAHDLPRSSIVDIVQVISTFDPEYPVSTELPFVCPTPYTALT